MSVQVKNLVKSFNGQVAVKNVSFEANENEILGFLGPNGAGKSTTMKIITCFLPPTEGTVIVNGFDINSNPREIKRLTGYLPENNPVYLDMYVHEYLRFIGKLNGIERGDLKFRVSEMVEKCGLGKEQNKLIGSLSKGYRQRVGLAQTLLHDPQVLILDEPTTGLDPNQITEVRNLIKEISRDKTVIISTHIMQEVQALCDKVVIINEGEIVADGALEELKNKNSARQKVKVRLSESIPIDEFKQIPDIEEVTLQGDSNTVLLVASPGKDIRPAINNVVGQKKLDLLELSLVEESLEDIFKQLTNPSN
jgi:ABC-2 type transport system ATP-binding protein